MSGPGLPSPFIVLELFSVTQIDDKQYEEERDKKMRPMQRQSVCHQWSPVEGTKCVGGDPI